jgi:hypothetical protein
MSNASTAVLAVIDVVLLGVVGLMGYGIVTAIIDQNKLNATRNDLNAKIASDMGVRKFEMSNIEINNDQETYIAKISGSATTYVGDKLNFAQAKYKINEEAFEMIKTEVGAIDTSTNTKDFSRDFLENILSILANSEFISDTKTNLAIIDENETAINLSEPIIDKANNTISYQVLLSRINNNNLELGTFEISTSLDQSLIDNPYLVYTKTKDECHASVIDRKTIKNVSDAHVYNNYAIAMQSQY